MPESEGFYGRGWAGSSALSRQQATPNYLTFGLSALRGLVLPSPRGILQAAASAAGSRRKQKCFEVLPPGCARVRHHRRAGVDEPLGRGAGGDPCSQSSGSGGHRGVDGDGASDAGGGQGLAGSSSLDCLSLIVQSLANHP
ncbi:nautilus-like [Frankliniella occidentalis]|nr:nautilus-like [Frankliniella occidentalis]